MAQQYLAGNIDEITEIDSLRKVREIFIAIRTQYRKLKQHTEAVQRQIESDPHSISRVKQERHEEHKDESVNNGEQEQDDSNRKKRKPMDKQQAFLEYKEEGEGKTLERAVVEYRNEMRDKRASVKTMTQVINMTKTEIDRVKHRLDGKNEEKKAQMKNGQDFNNDDDDNGYGNNHAPEEIIDEEELMLLKEMKDLKRSYRETFDKLKTVKNQISDIERNIDGLKQQIVVNFEQWYSEEFEQGQGEANESEYNQTLKNQYQKGQLSTYKGDSLLMGAAEDEVDEEALAFIRAKKNVDTLHKAKKLEKQRPGRH